MVEYSVCYIMDHFIYSTVTTLAKIAYTYPLVTLAISLLITLTMARGNITKLLLCNPFGNPENDYDYGFERGAHTWEMSGQHQSPIDINTGLVQEAIIREQLMWNHYNDLPSEVTIENNGKTVILRAKYPANVPTISGADLFHSYSFESLCFHWSFSNTEGSEHAIDGQKYAMEIQATHKNLPMLPCLTNLHSLIIAYVFQVAAYNPFFDPIVLNLHLIRKPGTIAEIPPFPLAWLCYQFKSGFFSYGGSNCTPPCKEGVEWFINPEPISIGESQLREFRSLLSSDGTSIIRNSRPVQCLNDRIVHVNKYERGENNCSSCDLHQHLLSNSNDSDEN